MSIVYSVNSGLSKEDFIDVLNRSTLGERRPVDDLECIGGMLEHADIIIVAKDGETIVGVARSVTDFYYCCYLSDLAVDRAYQYQGIGKELIKKTQEQVGEKCKVILLSAPAATGYYPKIGFTLHPSAWTLSKNN